MRKLIGLGLLLAGLSLADSAAAHGDVSCPPTPRSERRPAVDLQKELEKQGWKVRKMEKTNGCYEVYGYDANGNKVEAYFDPKTFKRVRPN